MLVPELTDVMTQDVESIPPDTYAIEAAKRLFGRDIGSVVVIDEGEPTGIITETDLIGLVADERNVSEVSAAECMSSSLVTIEASEPIARAAELLNDHRIKKLPVTDGTEIVGIVTARDLADYLPRVSLRQSRRTEEQRPSPSHDLTAEESEWAFDYQAQSAGSVTVGDVVEFRKSLSEADVRDFADASGDTDRLHLDDEFAAETRFGGRIVHGTLINSVISAALARIPGLPIYLTQDISYAEPVEIGERVTAVCEVSEDLGEHRYRFATAVYDEDGDRVLDGDAVVLIDDLPDSVDRAAEH